MSEKLSIFFHQTFKESDLTLMGLTFKVSAQNMVPSSESVKNKKRLVTSVFIIKSGLDFSSVSVSRHETILLHGVDTVG